jgi:Helix-turn-helix domain
MNTAEQQSAVPSTVHASILSEVIPEKQLARELTVHYKTLRRWHAERAGPPRITIGRRLFYSRAAVLEWLEKRQTGGVR